MDIAVFTSCQPRHIALLERLAAIAPQRQGNLFGPRIDSVESDAQGPNRKRARHHELCQNDAGNGKRDATWHQVFEELANGSLEQDK